MNNYRIPKGAIPEGDSVTFTFPSNNYDSVILHLIQDSTNLKTETIMENKGNNFKFKTFLETSLYWYYFEKVTGEEHTFTKTYQLNVYDRNFRVPEWLKGGIIYHIFVDRFCRVGKIPFKDNSILRYDWDTGIPKVTYDNGITHCNDFFGGNLLGIISKLDYLQELGVKCLYLSPIFEADSNHRYDTNDHMKIDKLVGKDWQLWLLCKLAKRKGIYVILDIALNHVGSSSKYFNNEKYNEWFTRYDDGSYDCWWGFPTLPAIKKDTPKSYKQHVKKVLRKWMRLGVKGFRLDVADELSNDLLIHIRNVVKDYDKDAVIFGEVWEDMSNKIAYGERKNYLEGDKLDSGMNYPFRQAILDFVKYGNSESLAKTIEYITTNYPEQVHPILMNMLSSHDEVRVATYLDGDVSKIKLAILLQMTIIGSPCIYYGDEVGMHGGKDPDNRRPMKWKNIDTEILNFYKYLSNLRRENTCIKLGSIDIIEVSDGIIKFSRKLNNEEVIITANAFTTEYSIEYKN